MTMLYLPELEPAGMVTSILCTTFWEDATLLPSPRLIPILDLDILIGRS